VAVDFKNIPARLKESCRFCVWKYEKRNGKKTKVPYNPVTGEYARTNDYRTFGDFKSTILAYAKGGYDGIGIAVGSDAVNTTSDGASASGINGATTESEKDHTHVAAFDIDHCIREDGSLNDVATNVLSIFPTAYVERSPSGTGLRGFFLVSEHYAFDATVYYINNRKQGLEVYFPGATNRFVTVTGDVYRTGEIPYSQGAAQTLLDALMKRPKQIVNTQMPHHSYLSDESVIEHAANAQNGEKFKNLYGGNWEEYYGSQSDADMALLSILTFWCGCDEDQIDRIFRSSGLMRPKWDRQQSGTTYGAISIRKAVATCSSVYLPANAQDVVEEDFLDLDDEENATDEKKKGTVDFEPDYSRVTLTIAEMQPHTNPRYGHDEIGMGNAFADFYRPIARFNSDRQVWFIFDGKIWRADTGNLKVSEMAKKLANALYCFAIDIKEEDVRKRFIDRVKRLQLRKHRDTMLKDAKSVYPISMEMFDQGSYLFNCKNGTLDLRTMEFREHRSEDYLTMMSGVTYDPKAICPRWDQFISEVMVQRTDLARFLQRSLGYALTADTSQECMFFLYGSTSRNGKGTTMETFLKIMGDYGKSSNPEMISAKFGDKTDGPSEDVARLHAARFVNVSELPDKVKFNSNLVKRMTGGNTMNARYLHENSFQYTPTYKLFVDTNYLPNVTDPTIFTSGRIHIIPFDRHFSEAEQDKGLKKLFAQPENLSAIFNWCLEGYKEYRRIGLKPPEESKKATEEYEADSDRTGQFVEAWLEPGEAYEVRTSAVYRLYGQWCEKYGFRAENIKNFNTAMSRHFKISRKRPKDGGNPTTMLVGARFRESEYGEEESVDDSAALK